jgi:hypothetical protein
VSAFSRVLSLFFHAFLRVLGPSRYVIRDRVMLLFKTEARDRAARFESNRATGRIVRSFGARDCPERNIVHELLSKVVIIEVDIRCGPTNGTDSKLPDYCRYFFEYFITTNRHKPGEVE